MQEAFRNQREMEWNSALAGRDEARPLPVHHSREQRTGRCGHRPLRRRSRLAVRRMAGAREETGERHAGSSCPTGESPGRDAPSWFPALAPERIEIIFRRGVYVAKNTSQAASVENGRPNGAAIFHTCGLRSIFHHVHAAAKNDPISFQRKRRKPRRGPAPSWNFPRTEDGDEGPHSAANSYRRPLLSAWPPSGSGGEPLPRVVDKTSLIPRRARRP